MSPSFAPSHWNIPREFHVSAGIQEYPTVPLLLLWSAVCSFPGVSQCVGFYTETEVMGQAGGEVKRPTWTSLVYQSFLLAFKNALIRPSKVISTVLRLAHFSGHHESFI